MTTGLAFTGVANLPIDVILIALLIGVGGALLLIAERRRRMS